MRLFNTLQNARPEQRYNVPDPNTFKAEDTDLAIVRKELGAVRVGIGAKVRPVGS